MLCDVLWCDKEVIINITDENYVEPFSKIYITEIKIRLGFWKKIDVIKNYKVANWTDSN